MLIKTTSEQVEQLQKEFYLSSGKKLNYGIKISTGS